MYYIYYVCDCHTDLRIVESFSLFSTLMGSFCKSRMTLAVQAKMFDRSEEGVVRRVAKTWSSLQAMSSIWGHPGLVNNSIPFC